MPTAKKRVKVKLHNNETIVNQIAYYSVRNSENLDEIREFIAETDKCKTIDALLRAILTRYEVEIEE